MYFFCLAKKIYVKMFPFLQFYLLEKVAKSPLFHLPAETTDYGLSDCHLLRYKVVFGDGTGQG